MKKMDTQEICSLISGGFFEEKTQCIVAIETVNTEECEIIPTVAVTPTQPADLLMDELARSVGKDLSVVNVNVYGIAGGIIGKGIVEQRLKS